MKKGFLFPSSVVFTALVLLTALPLQRLHARHHLERLTLECAMESATAGVLVRSSQWLRRDPSMTVSEIPLRVYCHQHVSISDLRASVNGNPVVMELDSSAYPLLDARLLLSPEMSKDSAYLLKLQYEVRQSAMERLVLPVVFTDWAPLDAHEGIFRASIKFPAPLLAALRFPAITPEKEGEVIEFGLQVVPAWLDIALREKGSTYFSPYLAIDTLVILLLLILGALLWKPFKSGRL